MTCVWFKHLQSLLCLFQRPSTDATWKTDSGFLPPAPDHPQVCPINQDGQHFADLIQAWDAALLAQGHRNGLHTLAAFHAANTAPSSHFIRAPKEHAPRHPAPAGATGPAPPLSGDCRPARADHKSDLKAVKPFFQLFQPPLTARVVLDQFHAASPQGSRKPVFWHVICFLSSAAAPLSARNKASCLHNQQSHVRACSNDVPDC